MQNTVQRSLFTTRNLNDNKERILAWRDSAGFIFDVEPIKGPDEAPFYATIESFNFGSMVTSVTETVASVWKRTPLDAARNGVDHFLFQFYMKGDQGFCGDRNESFVEAGDILILDASRTTNSQTEDLKNFTLWIPRNLLEPLLQDPDALHGKVLRKNHPTTIILRNYLFSLHTQAANMTQPEAESLVQPTLELIQSTFDTRADILDKNKHSTNAALLLAVKRYIHQHLDSDRLSVDSIAAAVNVSRASLYRICAPLGGINNYIRQLRLQQVLKSLVNPKLKHLSIAQIASYWGLHDPSSFNRIFRREFGLSPSDARNNPGHTSPHQQPLHASEKLVGDRQYEYWLTKLLI